MLFAESCGLEKELTVFGFICKPLLWLRVEVEVEVKLKLAAV